MYERFTVTGLAGPQRLDRILRARYPFSGRQAIDQLLARRQVQVNRRTVWLASWQVRNGDTVAVLAAPEPLPVQPTRFEPGWLVADEGDLLVVNKPAGLLSEPRPGLDRPSLLQLAVEQFGPLTLFHRLDRDTSGLLLLTRGGPLNAKLALAFQSGLVHKEYLALVEPSAALQKSGVIAVPLRPHRQRHDQMEVARCGGQPAVTRYSQIAASANRLWLCLQPETGRTHQLRVHLAHLGAPILGDRLYGHAHSAPRLMLHAHVLGLPAFLYGIDRWFVSPAPPEFDPPAGALLENVVEESPLSSAELRVQRSRPQKTELRSP